ncbi:unnamed protein product [Rotaria sordida]|uniref:FAD-binding FR-type domain-containing protein n=1 Tax=Rotaria sordida TaxID=392033 RepID=A0A814DRZ5_9BILA|nr:unnamed protein product [Rotaria sordida]
MFNGNNDQYVTREQVTDFYENYLAAMKYFDKQLLPNIIQVLLQRYHLDQKWIIVPFTIFVLEKVYSILKRYSSSSGRTYLLSVTIEQSNVISLTIHRPKNFIFSPGDYICINLPSIALYEFHPFTISSAPEEENYLKVHIHDKGDWTKRIYQYFKHMSDKLGDEAPVKVYRADLNPMRANVEERINVIGSLEDSNNDCCINVTTLQQEDSQIHSSKKAIVINGPYSSCARYIFDCKHVVLIGSGIGITPYASILSSLMARFRMQRTVCKHCQGVNYHGKHCLENHRLEKVDFIWVNRDVKSCEWFLHLLRQFENEQDEYLEANRDERRFLDIHLYLTGIKKDDNIGQAFLHHMINLWAEDVGDDIFTGLKSPTHFGRPDWDILFKSLILDDGTSIAKNSNVFFCGPKTMGKAIQQHCMNFGMHYYEEKF